MTQPGVYSYAEITTQGAAWRSALDAVTSKRDALLSLEEILRSRKTPPASVASDQKSVATPTS